MVSAGRTPYGWLFGTEVMPERGAELQTWIDEENGREPNDIHWSTWGFNALIGVTDQLSVGFPVELVWRDSDATSPSFTWRQFGAEARYRFVSSDPVDAPAFAPLARVAVKRDITERDMVQVEADLVASVGRPTGAVMALVDIGVIGNVTPDDSQLELHPGAGVSFKIVGDLRLGAEVYAELSLDADKESWAVVGPDLAWSHGRFWLSAALGIGVYQIDTAPRLQWGIMF